MGGETAMQLCLFGAPEPVTSYPDRDRGRGDDLPVPCEREMLWPASAIAAMTAEGMTAERAVDLLERLYGDVPRRTRLRVDEVCRRLRCDSNMVYRHIQETGELAAIDVSAGGGSYSSWRVYRASLVDFLLRREFGPVPGRTDIAPDDATRISRAVARMRRANSLNNNNRA
jgi:hypothetical protein